jgi:hypothetical protein
MAGGITSCKISFQKNFVKISIHAFSGARLDILTKTGYRNDQLLIIPKIIKVEHDFKRTGKMAEN